MCIWRTSQRSSEWSIVVIFIQQIRGEFHPQRHDMWTMWTDLHCGTICAQMEVWIQRQVLIRLRPMEMIEIHGNRKPQQVQLTQAWSRKRQNRESKPVMSQELQRPAFFRSTEKLGSLRSFLLCSNDPCPCSSWTKRYSRPLWNSSKKLLGLHYSMITELVMMFHDVSLSCFLPVSTFLARQ